MPGCEIGAHTVQCEHTEIKYFKYSKYAKHLMRAFSSNEWLSQAAAAAASKPKIQCSRLGQKFIRWSNVYEMDVRAQINDNFNCNPREKCVSPSPIESKRTNFIFLFDGFSGALSYFVCKFICLAFPKSGFQSSPSPHSPPPPLATASNLNRLQWYVVSTLVLTAECSHIRHCEWRHRALKLDKMCATRSHRSHKFPFVFVFASDHMRCTFGTPHASCSDYTFFPL